MLSYRGWTFEYNREATVLLYARKHGDAELFNSPDCQNLIAVRDDAFPAEFQELLLRLGIDPAKEYEQSRVGREGGGHLYAIAYYFLGGITGYGQPQLLTGQFQVNFEEHDGFVKVIVNAIVPWQIAEPEPAQ
ncbi:MAG: hypothetical protein MUE40_04490 [Anaerolineae bacterium]|nr:hypothetical protein [Anaerolineae bacterium]